METSQDGVMVKELICSETDSDLEPFLREARKLAYATWILSERSVHSRLHNNVACQTLISWMLGHEAGKSDRQTEFDASPVARIAGVSQGGLGRRRAWTPLLNLQKEGNDHITR